jgi:hypothetical protein
MYAKFKSHKCKGHFFQSLNDLKRFREELNWDIGVTNWLSYSSEYGEREALVTNSRQS